jgi:hypothetical protein
MRASRGTWRWTARGMVRWTERREGDGGQWGGRARAGGEGGAWTTRSCRTYSAPHSQERRPTGSVAEGPQPPPERGGGLGKAESGIAAHISGEKVRMLYVGRLRRHTGPELHPGGMRGSKPAGFSSTGEKVCGELSSLLTVKTLTGMTTDVYPRENCTASHSRPISEVIDLDSGPGGPESHQDTA